MQCARISFSALGLLSLVCAYNHAEHISAVTLAAVLCEADAARVPRSIAYNLILEESSGNARAVSAPTPDGWHSEGLLQLYMRPDNIEWLLSKYWYGCGETVVFEVFNPLHNARVGLRYLRDLHDWLGSWTRALWFYNCGRVTKPPHATRAYAARIVCDYEFATWRASR